MNHDRERGAAPRAVDGDRRARRYDAVLFDMGYTLVHFEPVQEEIVRGALRAAGVERTPAEINAAVAVVWPAYYRDAATATFPATEEHDRQTEIELSRALLLQLQVDPALVHAYRAALDAAFDRPGALRPYPEVPEVLRRLRADGYRLGIVSNWSWNLRRRVAQAGLDGHFELVWASAYAGCNKPHPAIFEQAQGQMGVDAARALYVGDSYDHDVRGARNAGVDVVLIERSTQRRERDCAVIGDLRELWTLLDG